jgi:hypothetical protein
MSRYQLKGKESRYRLIVGWDPSLTSFYAQVEDLAWESDGQGIDEDAAIGESPDEGLLVWVGAASPLQDPQMLVQAVAAYGTIPDDILQRLREDKIENKQLTKAHIPPALMRAAGKRYAEKRSQQEK